MNKLYLVDAYALIYRAYYAFIRVSRVNSKGINTSAIFGYLNTFDELMRREQPTHIAVVFDPAGPTFRHEQFSSYKANRDAAPEDIHIAVPFIKQIMDAYGIKVLQVPGYEADDVIGTLAVKAAALGFDVYMVTPDKDYGQLVTDHISIIKPRTGQTDIQHLGVQDITQRWGIDTPLQVIDLLGLMGDSSDNIPGCPGVGEKTAVKLINQYHSIENIIAHADEIKGAIGRKIKDNTRQILDSKYLATICTDVPVDFHPDQYARHDQNTPELIRIYTELEFKTHLAKLQPPLPSSPSSPTLFDTPVTTVPAPSESPLATLATTPHTYRTITSSDIDAIIADAMHSPRIAFTLITDTPESVTCTPVGIALSTREHHASYLPLPPDPATASHLLHRLAPIFTTPTIEKIAHNLKHQYIVLSRYGIDTAGTLFDNEIAHYLLQPEYKHDIDTLAPQYLRYTPIGIDTLIGAKGRRHTPIRQTDPDALARYAAERADITLRLHHTLRQNIADQNLTTLFTDIEMPLATVLARMEMTGVLLDHFALSQISEQLTARMTAIERNIRRLAGLDINLSSPKQVGELLFDTLHLSDKARKTKKGYYSTDEEVLESLRYKHPVVGDILEYRGLKKLLSTYIDALPRLINPHTGRVHTSFNQTITATGRLSSSNPNLQNIPIRNDQGREIRRAFIPTEGNIFLSADYSQIELRIMAHLSSDTNMLTAFRHDHDIHAATAANIYHTPIDQVTPDMRRKAKTANFGIIYGISAFGLSERLAIPRPEAKTLIDGYFDTFPAVRHYIDRVVGQAHTDGYVETLLHRRRYLPDITSRNTTVRSYAERNAVNAPIQGTAADIIKIAMVHIDARLREANLKTRMILQVHDELNFDVPPSELDTVTHIVRTEMESAINLAVPLRVDIGTGANWLEAH